jgi:hypothetical protein
MFSHLHEIIVTMALHHAYDYKYTIFRHPFTCICVGPTCSGKTQYIANLIKHKDAIIEPKVTRVIYSYKIYQPLFNTLPNVEFVQGLNFQLDRSAPTLLIIDDQMGECDSRLTELFTVCAHHENCSIIFVSQVLFFQDKAYRTACQNAMYLILFRSPRCKSQISHLARQMFAPGKAKKMLNAFDDATSKPFCNLIIDLKPDTPDALRLKSNILPDEGPLFQKVKLAHTYMI